MVQHSQQLKALAEVGQGGFREVQVSDTRLGVWPNKQARWPTPSPSLCGGLEDDILLNPDALRWFEWHVTSGLIFRRPEIGLSTCWSGAFPFDPTSRPTIYGGQHSGAAGQVHAQLVGNALGLGDVGRTWDKVGSNWTGRDLKLGELVRDDAHRPSVQQHRNPRFPPHGRHHGPRPRASHHLRLLLHRGPLRIQGDQTGAVR